MKQKFKPAPSLKTTPPQSATPPLPEDESTQSLAGNGRPLDRWQWALFIVLFALALLLRTHGLSVYPKPHQTNDEYHYMWVGLSLLHTGQPEAWSSIDAYESILHRRKGRIDYDGSPFMIVAPALDHPPLFSLLAGTVAQLTGARQIMTPLEKVIPGVSYYQRTGHVIGQIPIWDVNLGRVRILTLFLFSATFFLLFTLTRRAYSYGTAMVVCLFYATLSHVILQNRLVVTENLTTPLLLANLCALQSYLGGRATERRFGVLTALACAAAPLCKLIALAHPAIILCLLLGSEKRRATLYPIAGATAGLALYMLYGWWQGWHAFTTILQAQSSRFCGFDSINYILFKPYLVNISDFSMLLFCGWIGIFAQAYASRRVNLLVAPLIYLLVFVFFSQANAIGGWHLIVFFPFLCLGLGLLVHRAWQDCASPPYLLLLTLFLPFVTNLLSLADQNRHLGPFRYGYMLIAAALLVGLDFTPPEFRLPTRRVALVLLIGVALVSEVLRVWMNTSGLPGPSAY